MTEDELQELLDGAYIPAPVRRLMAEHSELKARLHTVEQERDAAWKAIERGWAIEPREYFEKEAPKNGFKYPLAQAVHHMWKRELKERGGEPIPASTLGPPVPACPQCGAFRLLERGARAWPELHICQDCGYGFDQPTFYRQVTAQP